MDIAIECNTPDEVLLGNIRENAQRPLRWVKLEEQLAEGADHAVLVGGGPSVADCLESIRWRKKLGQKVFALNNAARFLERHGIVADYQVIVDAREHNVRFAGSARQYLFASQCHPLLFDMVPADKVMLWHPKIDDAFDENVQPIEEDREYSLIGGGTTVGLSAMCLAYTLGYRKLHLYGYDSSHREAASHAYRQPENDTEPVVEVTAYGRKFRSSLAMARQCELFPDVANNLIALGCVVTMDGDGLLPYSFPRIWSPSLRSEQEKYEQMWEHEPYRVNSPGERIAEEFVRIAKPRLGEVVLDLGCGTGRGGKAVKRLCGCDVVYVDFARNCLQDGEFVQADLSVGIPAKGNFAFCCDVMEHIPPEQVEAVLRNVCASAPFAFFQIYLFDDHFGSYIGERLHLSVHPAAWWLRKLEQFGTLLAFKHGGESAVYYLKTFDYSEK